MDWLVRGLRSSVGLKFVMALTGLALFGFVVAHLLGNLQIFLGRDALNSYAANLKSLGPLLWVARLGLLGVFVLHIATALLLTKRNREARPVKYAVHKPLKSTSASRTMINTGMVVLIFVIYHLLHFTVGVVDGESYKLVETLADGTERHDVYGMVVASFSKAPVAIFYILAMVGLGFHLLHGLGSFFQSIGWNAPKYRGLTALAAKGITLAIVAGNILMPLACWLGWIDGAQAVAATTGGLN